MFENLNYVEFLVERRYVRLRVLDGELFLNTLDLDWIRETCYALGEYFHLRQWKDWQKNGGS